MYDRRTAIPTPRDIAVRHTLSRLRQRYGISATPGDYDVLLGRVQSAVDQLFQGRNARHLKTNIVFDVEFPGPIVRVVYDRVEGQIKTALPMTGDEAFAELTTVNTTSFVAQFEADMSTPPPAAEERARQTLVPISLMAALMSDISDLSIHQIQADIAQIRRTLSRLEQTWDGISRTLEDQGVDIYTWRPRTPEHRGLRSAIRACHSRLTDLERAERDFLARQAQNDRYRAHLCASRKLVEDVISIDGKKQASSISFLRVPGDAEFGLYHVIASGIPIGVCQKKEDQWHYLFYPAEGEKPKKMGRRPTRKEAATILLEISLKRAEASQ